MSDKKPAYNRCVNCGKYIETEIKDKSLFCCNECCEKYSPCNICTRYFDEKITHTESLKCKVFFSLNQKKRPYIKYTMLKIFIFGNPLLNMMMISDRLSSVLKLPLFVSEKFRIGSQLNISQIKNYIEQRIKAEKLQDYFLFLCNSYDTDFISELLNEISFDKIITIDSENINNNTSALYACNSCGNINSFFQTDDENESTCAICGNSYYKTTEEDILVTNKLKSYQECKSFISSTTTYKHIDFTTAPETAREIIKHLVFT